MTTRYEQLERLHAADPTDADITYMIAMEHTTPGMAPGASPGVSRGNKVDHSGQESAGNSGGSSGQNSGVDHQAVIDWLDKTLALDENYLYAYFQKAKAQSQLGHDDQATATLQLGIEKAEAVGDAKAVSELSELMATVSS